MRDRSKAPRFKAAARRKSYKRLEEQRLSTERNKNERAERLFRAALMVTGIRRKFRGTLKWIKSKGDRRNQQKQDHR